MTGTAAERTPLVALSLTDIGRGERLAAEYGDCLRHCELGWLAYDGRRWRRDTTGAGVMARAKRTVRAVYRAAAGVDDHKLRERLIEFARDSERERALGAMIHLAQSESPIGCSSSDFDSDPWALNVRNGTIDLQSGSLRRHDRGDMLTKLADVVYHPDAAAPTFVRFLAETFGGDDDLVGFVQRLAGYALTGNVAEHVLPICYGVGANGKSTLFELLAHVMGDCAMTAPPKLLLRRRSDQHPTELADLRGVRLVLTSESGDGDALDEERVKMLTGGDRIRARYCRQDFFEFQPTHKIIIATNHKPRVRGGDEGIWRRLKLIPFAHVVPVERRDPALLTKLKAESSGVLAWAVRGCLAWQRDGLGSARAVDDATADFRAGEDVVAAFLGERCKLGAGLRVPAGDLYRAFEAWTAGDEAARMTQRAFGAAFTARGFQRVSVKGYPHYEGVALVG